MGSQIRERIDKYINYKGISEELRDDIIKATLSGILEHNPEADDLWVAEELTVSLLESLSVFNLTPANRLSDDRKRYLTPEGRVRKVHGKHKDFAGNEFSTFVGMCDHYDMRAATVRKRLLQGLSLEEALVTKAYITRGDIVTDMNGKQYPDLDTMCKAHGTVDSLYKLRKARGCDLETCLSPDRTPEFLESYRDLGYRYDS